jgi:hypothetical protein
VGWGGDGRSCARRKKSARQNHVSTSVGSKKKEKGEKEEKEEKKRIHTNEFRASGARGSFRSCMEDGWDGWVSKRWDAQVAPNARGNCLRPGFQVRIRGAYMHAQNQ